jgi:hypothetical protein
MGLGSNGFLYKAARLCGLSIAATHVLKSTAAERREICIVGVGERQWCRGMNEEQLEIYSLYVGRPRLDYHAFAHTCIR